MVGTTIIYSGAGARRRLAWIVVTAACVALVGVLVLRPPWLSPSHTGRHPTAHPILPAIVISGQPGLRCAAALAWAPHAARLAIVGYQNDCPVGADDPSFIRVYDATTGQGEMAIRADLAIAQAVGLPATSLNIVYTHLLWSPDGARLAAVFLLNARTQFEGVLVVNDDGRQPLVLVQAQRGPAGYDVQEWDLSRHAPQSIWPPAPTADETAFFPLSAALSYRWGVNGTLTPLQSLTTVPPPATSASSPAGSPDGGTPFTVWQPGTARLNLQAYGSQGPVIENPGAYSWQSGFAVWSPDGRFLLTDLEVGGRLQPDGRPVPSQPQLTALGLANFPLCCPCAMLACWLPWRL